MDNNIQDQDPYKQNRQDLMELLDEPIVPSITKDRVLTDEKFESQQQKFDQDFEHSRSKLKEILDESIEAIEHFKDVAQETNEPRAFEVLGGLIKGAAEIAREITNNAHTKAKIDKESGVVHRHDMPGSGPGIAGSVPQQLTQTNNNTIFVGTTKDLLDAIQSQLTASIPVPVQEIKATEIVNDSPNAE